MDPKGAFRADQLFEPRRDGGHVIPGNILPDSHTSGISIGAGDYPIPNLGTQPLKDTR